MVYWQCSRFHNSKKVLRSVIMCAVFFLCTMITYGCGEKFSLQYPLPHSVENKVSDRDGSGERFDTALSVEEVISFYRDAFVTKYGFVEDGSRTVQKQGEAHTVFVDKNGSREIVVQVMRVS